MKFNEAQAASLVAAGRILQSTGVKIVKFDGENYPSAVLRVIENMTNNEKSKLRESVEWIRNYEKSDDSRKLA